MGNFLPLSRDYFCKEPDQLRIHVEDEQHGIVDDDALREAAPEWFKLYYESRMNDPQSVIPSTSDTLVGIQVVPVAAPSDNRPLLVLRGAYIKNGPDGLPTTVYEKRTTPLQIHTYNGEADYLAYSHAYGDKREDTFELSDTLSFQIANMMMCYYYKHHYHAPKDIVS